MKKIILFDFDGVIHSYKSGWKGARNIPDPPVDGALEFLTDLIFINDYDVYIYSSRSRQFGGKMAMKEWLRDWLGKELCVPPTNINAWQWRILNNYQSMEPWHIHTIEAINKFVKMIKFPTKKPSAFLTIDDRAICFDGDFSKLQNKIDNFKTWYNKKDI